jgi:hypothetical protein
MFHIGYSVLCFHILHVESGEDHRGKIEGKIEGKIDVQ